MKTTLTSALLILASIVWTANAQEAPAPLVYEYQGLVAPVILDQLEAAAGAALVDPASDRQVHAAAYNLLGICDYLRGLYEPALENFNRAIDIEPGRAAFYSNRGIIHRRLGDWPQAQADYQRALNLDPQNDYAQNNLGWLQLLQSQNESPYNYDADLADQAVDQLRSSQLPLAQVNLSAAYLLLNDIDAAEQTLPDYDPQLLRVTGQCLLINAGELARIDGNWVGSRRDYQQAYDIGRDQNLPPMDARLNNRNATNADNPWILQRLGLAEYALEDYSNAELHLTMAAEIFDGHIAGRYAAIMAHLAQRNINPEATFSTEVETALTWIDALELYMAGQISERRLTLMAPDDDENAQAAKTCEMHFYIAQQLLIENETEQASEHLRQCIETELPSTKLEVSLAAAQLQNVEN